MLPVKKLQITATQSKHADGNVLHINQEWTENICKLANYTRSNTLKTFHLISFSLFLSLYYYYYFFFIIGFVPGNSLFGPTLYPFLDRFFILNFSRAANNN